MMMQRFIAKTLVATMALSSMPAVAFAQQGTTRLAGTAKDEAQKPYTEYSVRTKDVKAGTVGTSMPLDAQGNFALTGMPTQNYLVELLNKEGKVVCTDGPFDLAKQPVKSDIVIDCRGIPVAWWLVGGATAFAAQQGTTRTAPGQPGQSTTLAGTAKDEAKKPFTEYTVRARDVKAGTIGGSTPLDVQGNFSLLGLSTQNYLVELLNKDGKVVCTEGPFDLAKQPIKSDVIVDCGGIPAAWWLVGAAAAAGITAGIVAAGGPASPSR